MHCGSQYLHGTDGTNHMIVRLRCRSWKCSHCAPRRQRRLKWEAAAGKPVTFITLTCRPDRYRSPGDAARALTSAWRILRKRIQRRYPKRRWEYLTVMEATKNGWPHLHVLTTIPWIDQRWLSQRWNELTGAPIVDIRRAKNARQAGSYIAKYISKQPIQFRGCKRYYFSRGYRPPREPDKLTHWLRSLDWTVLTGDWRDAVMELWAGGALLVALGQERAILAGRMQAPKLARAGPSPPAGAGGYPP